MYASSPRASLQRRIILLVVGGMVVVLVGFGISGFLAVRQSIDRTLEERLVVAQTTAGHLEYVLEQNLKRLEDIVFTPGVDLEDLNPEPEKRALHEAYLYSIFNEGVILTDRSGVVLWSEPYGLRSEGVRLGSLAPISQALQTGRAGFSNVVIEPSGEAMVSALAPMRNRAGEIVGLVIGNIELTSANLLDTVPPLRLGKTGYIEVVDGSGVVIASSKLERLLQESDHGNILADLIRKRQTTSGTCHSCHTGEQQEQRETEVLAFAPLPTVPWGVSIRQSEKEALAPARNMERGFLFVGLAMLGISLSFAWGTARSVVKPIGVLIEAARRISAGNLAEPIPNLGKDEVGLLSQSLNDMREKLKYSHEELDRLNRELEKRVEDRTKELAALVQTSQTLALITLDLDTLLQSIIETATKALEGADAGALLLYDRDANKLVVRAALGYDLEALSRVRLSPGEAIVGKVFASGEARLYATPDEVFQGISDAVPDNRTWLQKARSGAQPQSAICVPLKSKERTIGSLILVSLSKPDAFSSLDLRLLSAFAAQAALAIENATLYEELQRKEYLRGELLRKVISAQEEERKRIARDLHDDTSQALAALMVAMDTAAMMTSSNGEQLKVKLTDMKVLAAKALDGVHQMIYYLRPSVLDDLGLLSAIKWYGESRLEELGVKVRFESSGTEIRLPSQVETALFRAVQEAINNIARHAEAENVLIDVSFKNSTIIIDVEDDGRGFDIEAAVKSSQQGQGFGLAGMQERIALLDGTLTIQSEPDSGTHLRMEVPISPEDMSHG